MYLRISQLNGRAFCVDLHHRRAVRAGAPDDQVAQAARLARLAQLRCRRARRAAAGRDGRDTARADGPRPRPHGRPRRARRAGLRSAGVVRGADDHVQPSVRALPPPRARRPLTAAPSSGRTPDDRRHHPRRDRRPGRRDRRGAREPREEPL
uniref:carboxymuconolactone decarboxylase family protein n=1 Tax=Brachybacterium sp. GPGPB12 TaxID=3023517 RepID=UPI004049CE5A